MPTDVRTPCQTNWRPFTAPEDERTSGTTAQARIAAAQRLCRGCFKRIACRDEGRAIGAEGIWGGETDAERRRAGVIIVPPLPELPDRCGTDAGAKRHRRAKEALDAACLEAESRANRERKTRQRHQRPASMPRRGPQILTLLAQGMQPMAVARQLGVEKSTIYGSIARICTYLDTPIDQLVDVARERGIIPVAAAELGADDLGVAA